MSLSFCVLGSGSAGNSTLIAFGDGDHRTCILIDAGLSPRVTKMRLAMHGVHPDQISAILLTHLDTDHFYPGWVKVIQRRNLPIYVHHQHRNAAWRAGLTAKHAQLFRDQVQFNGCAKIDSVLLAHDDLGSVGYVIEYAAGGNVETSKRPNVEIGRAASPFSLDGSTLGSLDVSPGSGGGSEGRLRLGYATDLGQVPRMMLDRFTDLDALAIESNYDRQMQLESGRPWFLKRRIMGGNGHLSNEQSLEAVGKIAAQSALSQIALLHLSRQCNDPQLVQKLYAVCAPHLLARLTITNQYEPSEMLRVFKAPKPDGAVALGPSPPARISEVESKSMPLFEGVW